MALSFKAELSKQPSQLYDSLVDISLWASFILYPNEPHVTFGDKQAQILKYSPTRERLAGLRLLVIIPGVEIWP